MFWLKAKKRLPKPVSYPRNPLTIPSGTLIKVGTRLLPYPSISGSRLILFARYNYSGIEFRVDISFRKWEKKGSGSIPRAAWPLRKHPRRSRESASQGLRQHANDTVPIYDLEASRLLGLARITTTKKKEKKTEQARNESSSTNWILQSFFLHFLFQL